MPRPRVIETAQKQSPRGPPNLRTSSSDSDHQQPRPRTDRNPKPTDGRSIRAAQPDPSDQKKLGTRIAKLESQLGLAQDELKSLKDHLISTEYANKSKSEANSSVTYETSDNNIRKETDVYEVPFEKPLDDERNSDVQIPLLDELAMKKDEIISLLKAGLDDKDKELHILRQENTSLRSQLDEKTQKTSSAQAEIDELTTRLTDISQELEMSRADNVQMNEKFEYSEKAKEGLEKEMERLRMKSEQWRKAADAAASVLAEINGQRLPERCGSMDNVYERVGGRYVGSPGGLVGDGDDGFVGGEKRRGSGIRMLGELWKKKGQK